ncbi:hypothetical protein PFICI_09010 [Pestalotiopsis fici W106-1]|uniref:Uncharacterized protein n=1 Tax=Pestalotiopsis fici (strain W106-1 / CGMCC3.15140) TaxID=1229662 RepID=W3X183_PESFW|nr:uncharacterized protein PFICI_09010 [Pestalotiopsis fici W106-1]ETS79157.1 hypothetical protein PFICI_09010 [Pestalotiopsis fici W106-1]
MPKALDNLPLHLLELICEFIVAHDDDDAYSDKGAGVDLYAFALCSKTCWTAAKPQRFRQIQLWLSAADPCADGVAPFGFRQQHHIQRWVELLDKYDGWRHIRRLRVTCGPDEEARKQDPVIEWDSRHDFEVDYFLKPSKITNNFGLDDDDFGHGDFGHGDFGHGDFGHGDFGHGDFGHGDFGHDDFGHDDSGHDDLGHDDLGHDDLGHNDLGDGDLGDDDTSSHLYLRDGDTPSAFDLRDNDTNLVHLLPTFLSRVTVLQDLVWAPSQIPSRVVDMLATQFPQCRLHMHRFQLGSLWMHRDQVPQPISSQDWALVTSPNLCTAVAYCNSSDHKGNLGFLWPAVMDMVAGVAPSLQHVTFRPGPASAALGLLEARYGGRPPWAGFHPDLASGSGDGHDTRNCEDASRGTGEKTRGALRSLVYRQAVTDEEMLQYSERTDLTKLSHLTLRKTASQSLPLPTLAAQARAGEFCNLTSLCLQQMGPRGEHLGALNDILENIGPLKHLCLEGFVGNNSFNIILRRHGKTLRSLHLDSRGLFSENDERKPSELLRMTAAEVQRIAEFCPYLTEIEIPVSRSHGDAREVALYRALSQLGRLKRAWLHLCFWVGPDENASDDVPEEDMYQSWENAAVTLPHLKDAIVDCAIDGTLARSIFNVISDEGNARSTRSAATTSFSNLRWLRLDVRREIGRFATPGYEEPDFDGLLDLFTRSWVVERREESHDDKDGEVLSQAASPPSQNASGIVVTGLDEERAQRAAKEDWPEHDEWQHDSRKTFKTAFEELWQPDMNKPQWWNDWRSFPLQMSE